jgi:hypothetical protein
MKNIIQSAMDGMTTEQIHALARQKLTEGVRRALTRGAYGERPLEDAAHWLQSKMPEENAHAWTKTLYEETGIDARKSFVQITPQLTDIESWKRVVEFTQNQRKRNRER